MAGVSAGRPVHGVPAESPTARTIATVRWAGSVGWATRDGRTLVFARLLEDDKPEQVRAGWRARDTLFADWPSLMVQAQSGRTSSAEPTRASNETTLIAGLDHIPLAGA